MKSEDFFRKTADTRVRTRTRETQINRLHILKWKLESYGH